MKVLTACIIVFLAAGSFAESARKAIQKQYRAWAKASVANNVPAVLKILAPEYSLRTYSGTEIGYEAYVKSLKDRAKSGKKSSAYETEMKAISVSGKSASVTSWESSISLAKDPITGKDQKIVHVHEYKDTWVLMNKSWRLKRTVTTQERTSLAK